MKSYTSLEQSKKLVEILPLESADMCYLPTHIGDEHHFIASLSPYSACTKMSDVSIEYCTPCWSLAALLELMPSINGLKPVIDLDEKSISYSGTIIVENGDNLLDVAVNMIISLNNKNLIDRK